MTSLEDRVIELEVRLMHQEQTAEDLTAVLLRQERDIKALTAELRRMHNRMSTETGSGGDPAKDDTPPHY
ncbi:MAG: SlyX family protein [Alphaproteobacteria bacterium]